MSGYRGRFAPTPSGPLHFGSLVAALGSYLDARSVDGTWLVRIEDIDPPRCPTGTSDIILRQLETFGLTWDETVIYQSSRQQRYQQALERLIEQDMAYPCSCSRKQWQAYRIYPGWCRNGVCEPTKSCAWRLRSDRGLRPINWRDRRLGEQCFDPARLGDVVLKRKDDLWAYQLAVVVDDADQGITDVVRGADLLDNTPWQVQLQHALALPMPRYLHLPLILGADGHKLSKQNLAPPLPTDDRLIRAWLHAALHALSQAPVPELEQASVEEQLAQARAGWNIQHLPGFIDAGRHSLRTE